MKKRDSMQKKTLIIGGTGHIGSNLIPNLLANNYQCRVLIRDKSVLTGIQDLPIELVKGSIFNPSDLINAMEGCDSVFHLASPTILVAGIENEIIEGTKNILKAAVTSGIRRLLYTSSVVTIGFTNSLDHILTENDNNFINASSYHFAKRKAEELVLDAAGHGNLETIVVNPATVIGPRDFRTTVSSKPISMGMRRPLRFWFHAGITISHVMSVAEGHRLAMEKGKTGERYILGGQSLSIYDYFSLINSVNGFTSPQFKLPVFALLSVGFGFSCLQTIGIKDVPFDFKRAKALVGKYGAYSSEKAKKELGFSPMPAESAVRDYIEWKTNYSG